MCVCVCESDVYYIRHITHYILCAIRCKKSPGNRHESEMNECTVLIYVSRFL